MTIRPNSPLTLILLALSGTAAVAAGLTALPVPEPTDNPSTPQKVALGRQLFFDPLLSRDRDVSCSSCHDPQRAFADPRGRAISPGTAARTGRRNAPSLINVAYRKKLTWSGAASSLETQAMIPLLDHAELDMTEAELRERLQADPHYALAFRQVFGTAPTVRTWCGRSPVTSAP